MKKILIAIFLWSLATCVIAFASCTTSTSGHRLDGTKKVKAKELYFSNIYYKYTPATGYDIIRVDSIYKAGDTIIHGNSKLYVIY